MPLALSPILPAGLRRWAEPVEPALQKLLIPPRVMRAIESARDSSEGAEFARGLLDHLDIAVMVPEADAARIPASGPMVAVANHPFGIAEGLALASVLDRARPDWRIVANAALAGVGQLQSRLILVNPFETRASQKQNFAPLRRAREWLAGGGLLGIFPAGEVASLKLEGGLGDRFSMEDGGGAARAA